MIKKKSDDWWQIFENNNSRIWNPHAPYENQLEYQKIPTFSSLPILGLIDEEVIDLQWLSFLSKMLFADVVRNFERSPFCRESNKR